MNREFLDELFIQRLVNIKSYPKVEQRAWYAYGLNRCSGDALRILGYGAGIATPHSSPHRGSYLAVDLERLLARAAAMATKAGLILIGGWSESRDAVSRADTAGPCLAPSKRWRGREHQNLRR